jgi:hypothetical protein
VHLSLTCSLACEIYQHLIITVLGDFAIEISADIVEDHIEVVDGVNDFLWQEAL